MTRNKKWLTAAVLALWAVTLAALVAPALGTYEAAHATKATPVMLVKADGSSLAELPAALGAGGGLKIDGSGTPLPVSGTLIVNIGTAGTLALDASVDGLEGGLGTATTAAVDGDAAGSAVAHLRGINKKLAAGLSMTEASASGIATTLATMGGTALTKVRVKIDQTAASGVTAIIAAEANKVVYLHALYLRMEAAGNLTIEDSDGTDLTGPMPVAATGVVAIPFVSDKNGCLVTAGGKGLAINTSQKVYGYAIYSKE